MLEPDQRSQDIEKAKRVLLVEGPDDRMVMMRLRQQHSIDGGFEIFDRGGYQEVRKTLIALLNFEDDVKSKERIGVIVNADLDLLARWQSLSDVLRKKGYRPPRQPQTQGVILAPEGKSQVGIWLMPDNTLPGKLEDFLSFLVQPDDRVWHHGITSVANLPERRFREVDESKAHIHTWLAWQDEPGIQMSQAITKGLLRGENEVTRQFVSWLRAVFSP